ncbi:mannose-1-phosphate guanylyltransferase, partial [Candidatus Woesebacteria bacterium]|nr:mannose-1-phosphate guanylyltransferase [Candidatus Woesebacteria bacterium]
SKNFVVVHGNFFWTDIGDWKEVWENLIKDHAGNVIISGEEKGGEVINIDTSDALIHTDGRLIAAVDVDNLVIVDTKDVLLVTSKSHAQSVKKIVEKLKEEGRGELL